jgi:negative regulator of flagellin synthesis FlgM
LRRRIHFEPKAHGAAPAAKKLKKALKIYPFSPIHNVTSLNFNRKEMLYMRIDAYNQISQIYNTQTIARTNKSQTRSGLSDQVSISQTGRDYQVAKAAVSEASDIREDKVAQLKNLIDTGSYKVDEGDFASKLLASYGAAM